MLEIVVFFVNSFIFCLYQVTWKKFEYLLFRKDATQIFKILIMKFMLLEIVVSCQFIHILLISSCIDVYADMDTRLFPVSFDIEDTSVLTLQH